MIKGMTGYGTAQFIHKKIKTIVEVKSLNHRYFDISYHLPIGFGSIENKIRLLSQKYVDRGRLTVSVKIIDKPSQDISVNKDVVRKHLRYAGQLKKEFKLENDLQLSDILRLPGVVEARDVLVGPKDIWPGLEKGFKKALQSLEVMRKREGRSLSADISDKLRRMTLRVNKIKSRQTTIVNEKKKILKPEEFKSFQRSVDINEEISRLKHYVTEMKLLLKEKVSVGKRIDFIAQEMQRETNTIGSKLQDQVVSNAVIALKSKIEKIREQSQNVE